MKKQRQTIQTFVLVSVLIVNLIPITFSQNINESYNYIIITTSSLESSLEYFKNWKELIGYSVTIVTVSWIDSSYDGRDTAERIRNYLISVYQEWNVKYVLLAGDMNSVPMRYTYKPRISDMTIPTDFYYADLTSDWDSDGDGIYAEFLDDIWPDFTAEVFVGRIPLGDPNEMQQVCQKIIDYERDNGSWKQDVLLIGAISNFENEQQTGDEIGDNAVLMENIRNELLAPNGFMCTTLYEKQGLIPSLYQSDENLTRDTALIQLSSGYGIVNWASHGSAQGSYRRWWSQDTNGDRIPDMNEIRCEYFITSNDTIMLNDSQPFIAFSCSCTNSYPEDLGNLGVSLLKRGAVSFIGAVRESIYFPGWINESDGGNMAINYHFLKNLISEKMTISEALYSALTNSWYSDETPIFRNMLVFSLYGDPSLGLDTFSGLPLPTTPGSPLGPLSTEPGDMNSFICDISRESVYPVYLLLDFGDGGSLEKHGPFLSGENIIVSHKWQMPGDYLIRAKAVNMIGDESQWSQPSTIHVFGPIMGIESVTGGLFTINAVIRNVGDRQANSINWSIRIDGGPILVGRETEGTIQSLDSDSKTIVISQFVCGVGFPVEIIVSAICSEGSQEVSIVAANIFLSLIHIKGDTL